jgi:hypothetical protein
MAIYSHATDTLSTDRHGQKVTYDLFGRGYDVRSPLESLWKRT